MRIPRLHLDLPLTSNQIIELSGDRHHYLARVLRLRPNHPLIVFNGKGGECSAAVIAIEKRSSSIFVEQFIEVNRESPLYTELAIGLSKGERMDWVMQKATELGVSRIVPLYTERTEVKLDDKRLSNKLQHWQQIIISACEQSQRTVLPTLESPRKLPEYLLGCDKENKMLLDSNGSRCVTSDTNRPSSLALLVGPEGGLSDEEIAAAKTSGFVSYSLGPRILRTETAPVVALSLVQHYWGDLN